MLDKHSNMPVKHCSFAPSCGVTLASIEQSSCLSQCQGWLFTKLSLQTKQQCTVMLQQLVKDPVRVGEGHTYERGVIIQWMHINGVSPV